MTRTRTRDKDLPPRVYRHGQSYRFIPVDPTTGRNGRPINLGRDKGAALKRWAELIGETAPATDPDQPAAGTIAWLWERYAREEEPRKAASTRKSDQVQARRLLAVFGAMPITAIAPHHAVRYLDIRAKTAPVQGNREIALLRHWLTKACHWGLLPANPLMHLQYRNPEPPRDRYVTDDELAAAMDLARPYLRALMWLAYLTGLRRGDLLKLTRFQLGAAGIEVREEKTGKRVIVAWTTELRRVVDQALEASPDSRLFPLTVGAIDTAWTRFQDRWEEAGGARFALKDLRAKHATDFEAAGGDATAQLGHSQRGVTVRHYLRAPRTVTPIK